MPISELKVKIRTHIFTLMVIKQESEVERLILSIFRGDRTLGDAYVDYQNGSVTFTEGESLTENQKRKLKQILAAYKEYLIDRNTV